MNRPPALALRIAQAELIAAQRQIIDLQRSLIRDLRAGLLSAHQQLVTNAFKSAVNRPQHPGKRVR